MWLWICPSASMPNCCVTHVSEGTTAADIHWMTNGRAFYSCHPLPLLWALATSAKTFLPSFIMCLRIPLEAASTSIPAHPVPPTPVHEPSIVPKACSVLEEIFIFFSLHTLIRQYWLALTHIFLMEYYCQCLSETSFFLGQRRETFLGGSVGLWLKCFSSLSTAPLQL